MAALSLTKQALSVLGREKPHSSITDLVEILTSPNYEDEAYDGIPELVESINLQPTGPAEASRAIRKKLKHGDSHRQYRALVLLKATVENGGQRFQTTFADGQLTDAIKNLVADPGTDPKVKRKLISVLGSWHRQFEGTPSMSLVANLYKSVPHAAPAKATMYLGVPVESDYERRKREEREAKEEAKRKAKEEKRRKEEEARQRKRRQREPFVFEKEKPQILQAIAETSQASNNLVNALTLVNTEHESVQDNAKVQECLEMAKLARKRVVRYIQLVENEELIGTLLETNERVIAALQMYDKLIKPVMTEQDVEEMQQHMAAAKITDAGELSKLQDKQRAAIARQVNRDRERERSGAAYESPPSSAGLHPDLQELSFGGIDTHADLPPPIRPDAHGSDDEDFDARGSLSDFSDYDSSNEETHRRAATAPSSKQITGTSYRASSSRHYPTGSDVETDVREDPRQGLTQEDPFADPFGDQQEVPTPGITHRKQMDW
ncbi:uncharacterized protein FOMMEDRAFT_82732 [Fomitiporia mediterranea MF3/22]|uniref:uncharacterized protein n=1 Tax=Fomitiporia mediterranea (strain MF3/22) TaxID=694068 RepID=UPI0004407493|nr:uncharacterized protein FOMMEDRAFT_82732 [Fomitiporia mediterranea MF3/22]EJD03661.1 hypothetical protein FOMMEDRAFT_82732 [Fomitiporia mediterranea MF3/22]